MTATAWEVIPPLGISIIPNCDGQGLGNQMNVSRETTVASDAQQAPSHSLAGEPEVNVSRETIESPPGQVGLGASELATDSRDGEEPQLSAGIGADLDRVQLNGDDSVDHGDRTENSDTAGTAGVSTEKASIEKVSTGGVIEDRLGGDGGAVPEVPEGMTAPETVKRILGMEATSNPSTDDVRILAVANQKGGVGKTTSAVNIAAALALLGYEVLLIDMDPQGNASTALGVDHAPGTISTYEVLVNGKSLLDVVQPSPGLSGLTVAPATVDLAGAEIELVSEMGREGRLRSALAQYLGEHEERHRKLDFVLVDCPPSLGLLTINALAAVDEILIPLQCEYYALEGLGQLMGSVGLVREYVNPTLTVGGIVLTMYDGRTKLAPQVAEEARVHFPELVYEAIIPRSVRISEAPSYSQTVLTYDPASAGAKAYLACARELVTR